MIQKHSQSLDNHSTNPILRIYETKLSSKLILFLQQPHLFNTKIHTTPIYLSCESHNLP